MPQTNMPAGRFLPDAGSPLWGELVADIKTDRDEDFNRPWRRAENRADFGSNYGTVIVIY